MLVEPITIDGLDENDFRRSIEAMLRHGEADDAAAKLRALLAPHAGPGKLLPARFLTVSPAEVSLTGWQDLRARIGKYDRPDHLISALRIAITDPDPEAPAPAPDPSGKLSPLVETSYFSDTSFPFSEADRNDLLDGYSMDDSAWQGDFEAADSAVKVEGIDDLYGSVAAIEARVMRSDQPDGDDIRAGSLGACYLAVLVHQAVRETVHTAGLPRALCVMAGNDGVYPFFDAPVLARDEYPDDGATMTMPHSLSPASSNPDEAEPDETTEGPYDFSRLSSGTKRKARKTPVLMLDAAEAQLASHEYEAGAAQQLADADADDRSSLLAVHVAASVAVTPATTDATRFTADTPESGNNRVADAPASAVIEAETSAKRDVAPIFETVDAPTAPPHETNVFGAAIASTENADQTADAEPGAFDRPPPAPPSLSEPLPHIATRPAVRSLRARLTVEPEPQPGLVDRLLAALRGALVRLGLT